MADALKLETKRLFHHKRIYFVSNFPITVIDNNLTSYFIIKILSSFNFLLKIHSFNARGYQKIISKYFDLYLFEMLR